MNRADFTPWLRARLAARTGIPPERIDFDQPLEAIGLDSMEAVELTAEIEAKLGRKVEPTALWDHPTATALIGALLGEDDPVGDLSDAQVQAELERLLAERERS